ncbi:MAG: Gfo/Idh/MocA family oxidoreductase [Hyphomicrobiaceae bacterium]
MRARPRIGVLGAGYFARFHYDGWARLDGTGAVTLAATADRVAEKARAIASEHSIPAVYTDLEAMLGEADLDLLDIAAPPPTHLAAIRAAVSRGIAVICQKPFCRSIVEAEAATSLALAAGVPLVVHENFRFQPWHRQIKRLIGEGVVGAPYQVTFHMRPGDGQGPAAYLDRQPYFQTMPRFLIHETGIHAIDLFRWFLGEITAVYADLRRLNPVIAGEDAGIVLFDFSSGARGVLDGNRLVDHQARNHRLVIGPLLIEGSTGVLRLDGDGRLFHRRKGDYDEMPISYAWHDRGFGGDCVHSLQQATIAALNDGRPPENTAADYLRNIRVEEAVYRSSAEGRKVTIGDLLGSD